MSSPLHMVPSRTGQEEAEMFSLIRDARTSSSPLAGLAFAVSECQGVLHEEHLIFKYSEGDN